MLFKARKESDRSPSSSGVLAEAAGWLKALEGIGRPAHKDPMLNTRFYAWLMHSPDRVRAFLEICNVYSTLNEASCRFVMNPATERSLASDRRSPRLPKLSRLVQLAAGLAAVCIAAVCAWIWEHPFATAKTDITNYTTRVGERTIIPFADGATVYLNTASHIVLHSSANLRAMRLLTGEALFDVPAAGTPIRLTADELQIDSLGAQFDVRREAQRTLVSVLDGRVRLVCRCIAGEIMLAVGEQLEVSHQDGAPRLQRRTLLASEREHLVMWRDGHLFFAGAPLATAVKELNRYNRRQLVVGDAATADLRIGGRFSANDVDSFVAAIQKTFGVHAQFVHGSQLDTYIVLSSRNASQITSSVTESPAETMALQQY